MKGRRFSVRSMAPLSGLALLLLGSTAAMGQQLQDRTGPPPPADATGLMPAETDDQVSFAADALDYDEDADLVTASGDVRMLRAGSRLRADKVVWNRTSGEVTASGNVAVINPGGDTAYGDKVVITDDMKDGVVENMLLVLADGGRLAAKRGTRKGNIATLEQAAYTPCRVATDANCAKEPSWKITALRIVHDAGRHRIYYRDTRFHLFGLPVMWLPAFSHPDGSNQEGGASGALLPDIQVSGATGIEFALPYYWQMGPNRDLTVTPHIYSKVLPAIEGTYRQLDSRGAFQVRSMVTYGSRLPATANASGLDKNQGIRGFIDGNGTYQLGPNWTLRGQLRVETDRTFMKRYDISNDDRLRSAIQAERIGQDSFFSISGWFVQTIRSGDKQGAQPIALPLIDWRRRINEPLLGGTVQLQANTLALTRTAGQDTQRVFAGVRWDLRRLTPLGQEITFTAYGRADGYHTDDTLSTTTARYRGLPGWHGRMIGALAVDARWPLIGTFAGGTQQIIPRIQLVATPTVRNIVIPNEDSRSVDLEDTNLFALNRYSGYDRWEDGNRVTYGVEWNYQRPKLDLRATVGQSYRLSTEPTLLPSGTGLTDRFSDYVGRLTIKYGSWLEITERLRIDKDKYALRRNEIDAVIGGRKTYVMVGYLLLNRNIDTTLEDLRDRQEIRIGGRIQLARFWSVYGSTVVDLTSRRQDPSVITDGYQPVRNRIGINYDDECLSIGLTWRRDYDPTGDARRGSTFSLRLALKNIGR